MFRGTERSQRLTISSRSLATVILLVQNVHALLTINATLTGGRNVSIQWSRTPGDPASFILQSSGPFNSSVPARFKEQELRDALTQPGIRRGANITYVKADGRNTGNESLTLDDEQYVPFLCDVTVKSSLP